MSICASVIRLEFYLYECTGSVGVSVQIGSSQSFLAFLSDFYPITSAMRLMGNGSDYSGEEVPEKRRKR